jgi:1-acyl-sn-glycerol-3-phosphate acyltransferase
MTLRMIRRAVALVFVLAASVVRYWLLRVRGPLTLERRARWLQDTCIRVLRSIDVRWDVKGTVPTHGLVVSNHLSYLDIAVLSAAMPCFFVAKSEIDGWPFFGKAARVGGTLFIDRSSLASAEKIARMIGERLKRSVPVLLFPEGTSTDGTMRRFHSRLFEPAVLAGEPVTAAGLRYATDDGTPERELCWFGDATLGPHVLKTLKRRGIRAELRFGGPQVYSDRRADAEATFAEIAAMRAASADSVEAGVLQAV